MKGNKLVIFLEKDVKYWASKWLTMSARSFQSGCNQKKNPLINHLINKHMNRPSDKTMAGIEALKKEGLLYALKGGLE